MASRIQGRRVLMADRFGGERHVELVVVEKRAFSFEVRDTIEPDERTVKPFYSFDDALECFDAMVREVRDAGD